MLAVMDTQEVLSADTAMHSNRFAPLLAAVAPTLRQLSLLLEEPLDAAMAAALRGLTGLMWLHVRLGGKDLKSRFLAGAGDGGTAEGARRESRRRLLCALTSACWRACPGCTT
ncbi:hypothetical protein ABPG75_013613 [Micractinium tetrahymenae]